ncbi:TolC family protein [Brevibacillus sp. SYP-B805]|uniref:TolC family protein n=1 Tax=Brevibacillus sp. SYP-B805 TaxID=1578199 RepID=UPI0013ED058E|nr:TolC family protein [Brevibacillus sp. SYP-B805]NGQ95593.1 TolC family protein [Brevibacillus sp. SYP-B805]
MKIPYSNQKWTALALAALMLATTDSALAADNPPAGSGQQTPQAAQPAEQTAAKAQPLTIEAAIEQALKTNSDLQKLRIDANNADINARLVVASANDIPASAIESLSAAQNKYESEARAQVTKKLNALAVKAAENKTKLGAQSVFYDLLHAQAELELKKQSLKRAETQLKVAQAAFDVGTKAKTDILQAEMGVSGAQAALAVAQNNVAISRMKLNDFLGVDLQSEWILSDANRQVKAPEMTLEEAVSKALAQRTEMVQRNEELKLAELNRDLISKYSALSTYQGQMSRNNIEKAKLAIEDQKRAISMEVAQAYYNLNAAKLNVEFTQKAKEAAAESYRLTNLRFQNGLATTLEVIQAEEELSDRENQYQEAVHSYNLAVVNFETALGE